MAARSTTKGPEQDLSYMGSAVCTKRSRTMAEITIKRYYEILGFA